MPAGPGVWPRRSGSPDPRLVRPAAPGPRTPPCSFALPHRRTLPFDRPWSAPRGPFQGGGAWWHQKIGEEATMTTTTTTTEHEATVAALRTSVFGALTPLQLDGIAHLSDL